MRDFTVEIYKQLLKALKDADYQFISFEDYCRGNIDSEKWIILRHDVDDLKLHSLEFAQVQNTMGIKGVYYFRMVPESYDPDVIKKIYSLGHEVGYHYEDMDFARGDNTEAFAFFKKHLQVLRELVPINTICMHGSPLSKYDNREIWRNYSYKDLGIIGEPYFDFDFNAVYYITDTGRAWDGHKYNIRDKAPVENPLINPDFIERNYHSTEDIIQAILNGTYPDKVMMNFHPERWTDNNGQWIMQFVKQNLKNQVKRLILLARQ